MSRRYEIHGLHDRTSFAVLFVVCCALSALTVAARPGTGGEWSSAEVGEALAAPIVNGNNALFFDGVNDYLEIPEIVADTGSTGLDSRTQIPTNVWFHICCVWDGANSYYKLYLNGELIPQQLKGGAPLRLTGEPIRIGTDGHRNQCFNGMIDEVRLWNVARSQGDVRSTMNRKLRGDEPGLVGYWDFDEGEGQVVCDYSISGNRGRLGRLPFPDDADPTWVGSGIELANPR